MTGCSVPRMVPSNSYLAKSVIHKRGSYAHPFPPRLSRSFIISCIPSIPRLIHNVAFLACVHDSQRNFAPFIFAFCYCSCLEYVPYGVGIHHEWCSGGPFLVPVYKPVLFGGTTMSEVNRDRRRDLACVLFVHRFVFFLQFRQLPNSIVVCMVDSSSSMKMTLSLRTSLYCSVCQWVVES